MFCIREKFFLSLRLFNKGIALFIFFFLFTFCGGNKKDSGGNKENQTSVSCECVKEGSSVVSIEAKTVEKAEQECLSKGTGYTLQKCDQS